MEVEFVNGDGKQYTRRYPFAHSRARYIRQAISQIYTQQRTINTILSTAQSSSQTRRLLVEIITGVGPKQASLFLRNVGYATDLAILDSHVIRYMGCVGLLSTHSRQPTSLSQYETIEEILKSYANGLGFPLSDLDIAIWTVMREAGRDYVQ